MLSSSPACLHSLLVLSVALPSAGLRHWLLDGSRSVVEGSFHSRIYGSLSCMCCYPCQVDPTRTLSRELIHGLCFLREALLGSRKVTAGTWSDWLFHTEQWDRSSALRLRKFPLLWCLCESAGTLLPWIIGARTGDHIVHPQRYQLSLHCNKDRSGQTLASSAIASQAVQIESQENQSKSERNLNGALTSGNSSSDMFMSATL